MDWPDWWSWELDCNNPHLLKRMSDRKFNEADLREMLQVATAWRVDSASGRFVVETMWQRRRWEVIVEPETARQLLVVVTAYSIE